VLQTQNRVWQTQGTLVVGRMVMQCR
jgi:hypothetical protein